ncbi:unnamed protein product [Ixodes pacificus]
MDSARSWLVAAGCCWISVFTFSMIRSAAILYVGILDTFHVTREEASWPISVTGSVYFMTALVGGILARYIKIWKLTLAGCLICSSAVSVCYFATSIWYLAVFLGCIHGAGVGLLSLTTVVINQHFVKYRAVASGLNMAGFSIGGLLFPPLAQFFFAEYGLRPMFLLCGAVILNAAAGAILQRIPPCPDKASAARQQCGQGEEKPPVIMPAGDEENLLLKQPSPRSPASSVKPGNKSCIFSDREEISCFNLLCKVKQLPASNNPRLTPEGHVLMTKFAHHERTYYDEATSQYEHQNGDKVSRSLLTATDMCNKQVECEASTKGISDVALSSTNHNGGLYGSKPKRADSMNSLIMPKGETLHTTRNDKNVASNYKEVKRKRCLSFLKSPMFYLVMSTQAVISFNMTSYLTVIVDFAEDRGISKWNSVFLLSSYTVTDLAARLGSGWITDRHVFSRSSWTAVNFFLWAVSLFVIPVCNDYYYQVSMSVVAGWCNGSTLTLIPVLLMDIVELSEYGVCYGVSSFAVGVLGFLRPSMIGHYRDKLGDYEGLFFLLAQCTLVLAFFWMCASAYDRCLANRHKTAMRCTQGYFWRLEKLESMGNRDSSPS